MGKITPEEDEAIRYMFFSFGIIDLITASFLVFSILLFRKLNKLSVRLVFVLAFLLMGQSVSWITDPWVKDSYGLCYFQALALQLSYTAVSLWVSIISFNLCYAVLAQKPPPWYYELIYQAIVWPIIILSCVPPIATDDYGPAGQWCWIESNYYGYIWRLVCFYIPLYCYLLFNLGVYAVILSKVGVSFLRNWDSKVDRRKARDRLIFGGKLSLFPLVYICLWILPLTNRIYNWATDDSDPQFALVVLHTLSLGSQAPFFLLVYGFNQSIRNDYWQLIKLILHTVTCQRYEVLNPRSTATVQNSFTDAASTSDTLDGDYWHAPGTPRSTFFKREKKHSLLSNKYVLMQDDNNTTTRGGGTGDVENAGTPMARLSDQGNA